MDDSYSETTINQTFLRPECTVSRPHADRFLPKANLDAVRPGGLAEACGARVNRILEFHAPAPPPKRQLAAADFLNQFSQQSMTFKAPYNRNINTKPAKILDAPGLADEFYSNVLDWSPALNIMAIGLESSVYAWDPNSQEVSVVAQLENDLVSAVRWTDDSCIAISTVSGSVQVWDAQEAKLLRTMGGRTGRVACLSWNDCLLSSGGRDGSVWHHDVRVRQHKVQELRSHSGEVCGLEWRSDGRVLASGGNDNVVCVWDQRATTPRLMLQQHEAAVKAVRWCPWQTNVLATGGGSADRTVKLWNAVSGTCTETLEAGAQVASLHWNTEHHELVAALGYPTNSICVWSQQPSLKFAKQVEILNAHESRILHSTISADGTTLVTGAADENLKFWELFEPKKHITRSRLALGRV